MLGFWVRSPPETCLSVCCECFSGSVRYLCDGQIPLPEEFYGVRCACDLEREYVPEYDLETEFAISECDLETECGVSECELEISTVCRPRPTMGCQAM